MIVFWRTSYFQVNNDSKCKRPKPIKPIAGTASPVVSVSVGKSPSPFQPTGKVFKSLSPRPSSTNILWTSGGITPKSQIPDSIPNQVFLAPVASSNTPASSTASPGRSEHYKTGSVLTKDGSTEWSLSEPVSTGSLPTSNIVIVPLHHGQISRNIQPIPTAKLGDLATQEVRVISDIRPTVTAQQTAPSIQLLPQMQPTDVRVYFVL